MPILMIALFALAVFGLIGIFLALRLCSKRRRSSPRNPPQPQQPGEETSGVEALSGPRGQFCWLSFVAQP